MKRRLTKSGMTLRELILISEQAFSQKLIDDKRRRADLDLVSAKITSRRNLEYNATEKRWEQSNRYGVIIRCMVKSKPISYKRIDKLASHTYPCIIHLLDFDSGVDSPVKLRTGTQYRWKKTPKGSTAKQRQKIAESNIKKGIQADFLFSDMWVFAKRGILYGINTTNGQPPDIKNKQQIPYLDKTMWFCVEKIILPLLSQTKGMHLNRLFKKE